MSKKKVLARICYVVCILAIIGAGLLLSLSLKQFLDITDEVCISRNIYKVSVQNAEKYLREENIEYIKDGGQFEVGRVYFTTVENILTIDSEKGGTSYCVDIALNADFSDARQTFKNNETTYDFKDIYIIEKDGSFKYYIYSTELYVFCIIIYAVIVSIAVIFLSKDPLKLFEKKR